MNESSLVQKRAFLIQKDDVGGAQTAVWTRFTMRDPGPTAPEGGGGNDGRACSDGNDEGARAGRRWVLDDRTRRRARVGGDHRDRRHVQHARGDESRSARRMGAVGDAGHRRGPTVGRDPAGGRQRHVDQHVLQTGCRRQHVSGGQCAERYHDQHHVCFQRLHVRQTWGAHVGGHDHPDQRVDRGQ